MTPPSESAALRAERIDQPVTLARVDGTLLQFPQPKTAGPSALRVNSWVRSDEKPPLSRLGLTTYVAAGIAHVLLLVGLSINLAQPPLPIQEPEFIDLASMPPPPKPPEVKVEPPKNIQLKIIPTPRIAEVKPPPMEIPIPPPIPLVRDVPPTQEVETPVAHIVPSKTYLADLFGHLARNKRYPQAARLAHQQGTAYLRFTMDRKGHVVRHHLDRSSGHRDLDNEVEAMIVRADPLPPLPADMPDLVELLIPIEFTLK